MVKNLVETKKEVVFKAQIIEKEDGSAITEIMKDNEIIETKSHENTNKAIYYLRFSGRTEGNQFLEATLLTNDSKSINVLNNLYLIENKSGVRVWLGH